MRKKKEEKMPFRPTGSNRTYDARIVYEHPQGRYIVVEYEVIGMMGGQVHRLRETILTPERRGLASTVPKQCLTAAERTEMRVAKTKKCRRPITPEEEDEIRRLYREGLSMKNIARRIGRSFYFVRDYLMREGLWKAQKIAR